MNLHQTHAELLNVSGICSEIAHARGYRTEITKAELRRLGFKDLQCRVPALLIPLWNLAGEISGYQLRPDEPRIDPKGRLIKYEALQGSTMALDVNPMARQWVADPARPLFITEGVRKGDSAASRGLACLALLGVWNWRGSNELGGRTALADWEYVALNQRRVYLVFDSDVMTKPGVHAALSRLKGFLENRGADVLVAYLPCGEGGVKVGLDDFLAAERSVDDLLALATPDLRPAPAPEGADEPQHPYCERGGGIVRLEWKRVEGVDVQIPEPLTNFLARIVGDVLEDDGEERRRVFEIEAALKGRSQRVPVPSRDFNNLNWASEHLGAEALVYPGFGTRDHARAAIQLLSGSIPIRTVYTHLGWRRIAGEWAYLHAGGAIGADEVSVSPTRGLERYRLPDVPDEESVREAVRRSLRFLEIAPRPQTWPLLAAVFTAPLNEVAPCDFTLWLYGESGQRKSTVAALVLCHYGDFDRNHLPANLTSTGNALELQAFAAKDALLVVDDYAPASDPRTAAQQDQAVHRLLRAVGDSRGRNRATADAKLRGERAPRCLPLVTAELPPPGSQSSEARTLEVEWTKGGTNLDRLTQAQQEDAGLYPITLAGYVAWLAPRLEALRQALPPWIRQAATKFPAAHGRIQDSAAKLWAGAEYFLIFARSVNAVTDDELAAYREEARAALAACAVRTGGYQAQRRPTAMFREYLTTLFIQGRVYVVDRCTGQAPTDDPEAWGYTVTESNGERHASVRSIAEKIGWVEEETGTLYLDRKSVV